MLDDNILSAFLFVGKSIPSKPRDPAFDFYSIRALFSRHKTKRSVELANHPDVQRRKPPVDFFLRSFDETLDRPFTRCAAQLRCTTVCLDSLR